MPSNIDSGLVAVTGKTLTHAAISSNSTGDITIVSAQANQTVRVFRIYFTVDADTNITFKDGAGTSLTGAMTFYSGGAHVFEFQRPPLWTTSAGNAFIINQSGTAQISGGIDYQQS